MTSTLEIATKFSNHYPKIHMFLLCTVYLNCSAPQIWHHNPTHSKLICCFFARYATHYCPNLVGGPLSVPLNILGSALGLVTNILSLVLHILASSLQGITDIAGSILQVTKPNQYHDVMENFYRMHFNRTNFRKSTFQLIVRIWKNWISSFFGLEVFKGVQIQYFNRQSFCKSDWQINPQCSNTAHMLKITCYTPRQCGSYCDRKYLDIVNCAVDSTLKISGNRRRSVTERCQFNC